MHLEELVAADDMNLPAVALMNDLAFRLKNFDIGPLESDLSLGVGHL